MGRSRGTFGIQKNLEIITPGVERGALGLPRTSLTFLTPPRGPPSPSSPHPGDLPHLMMFLMRRKKAFLAEVQKLVP